MANRPDYVPPIRFGEGRGSRSPRAVVLELLGAPPASLAFGTYQLVHGHALASVVLLVFAVIAVVQAVIYLPRALSASRQTQRNET